MTMDWFTTSTEAVNTAFYIIAGLSVAMLILITVLMVVFAVRYRRKRHPRAVQIKGNVMLEIVWTVIPTLLALGMFYIGWVGFKVMRKVPEGALEVTAKARMWSWEFVYENGKSSEELVVPQGVPVRVDLESADVIHSFYVPAYRIKQDIVPGLETYTWFQPVDTGRFDIFCAEYCGQRHAFMMSKVVVVPEEEFRAWIERDVAPPAAPAGGEETGEEAAARLRKAGERLSRVKGCNACHSTDGTRLVGPSYKDLFGQQVTVLTGGKTRVVTIDEEYVRRAIVEPAADVVEGYQPVMPKIEMTDEDVSAIIEYLKTL